MKKLWAMILAVMLLFSLLPAAAAEETAEVYWEIEAYSTGGSQVIAEGYSSFQEALDKNKNITDSEVMSLYLQKNLTGNWTIDKKLWIYLNGYSITAKDSAPIFVVDCDDHDGLGVYDSGSLHAADGQPAILVQSGFLELSEDISFTNPSSSCDIDYEGGSLSLGPVSYLRIKNSSDASMTPGNELPLEDYYNDTLDYFDASGNDLTELQPGEICYINNYPHIRVDGISLASGQYITNDDILGSGEPDGTGYAYYHDGVLTLNNFKGNQIDAEYMSLAVELIGDNFLSFDLDDPIEADDANVTIFGDGSLTIEADDSEGIDVDDGNLTIKSGTLNVTAKVGSDPDSQTNHGIEVDTGVFTIEGGSLTVTAEGADADGLHVPEGSLIINGGSITIHSQDHGIEVGDSDELEEDNAISSFRMNGGMLVINAGDDGVNAYASVTINGGTLDITAEDTGIDNDTSDITINGGNITIFAEDEDGISTGDSNYLDLYPTHPDLTIRGGNITIDAHDRALRSYGTANLLGGNLSLNVRDPRGLTVSALLSLNAPGMQVISNVYDPWNAEEGAYVYSIVTESASIPHTGDQTPIALLCALMALSLASLCILRKRSA